MHAAGQLIELCRKCRLAERLRSAQERMSSHFPLTESLWLAWVNDELGQGLEGAEDVQRISALFARATQDYLSPAIWVAYLE